MNVAEEGASGTTCDPKTCGSGHTTAKLMSVPFLGTVPCYQDVVKACDEGRPVMSRQGDSDFHRAFEAVVDKIVEES